MRIRIDNSIFKDTTSQKDKLELDFLLMLVNYHKDRYDLSIDADCLNVIQDPDLIPEGSSNHILLSEYALKSINDVQSGTSVNPDDFGCFIMTGGESETKKRHFSKREAIRFLMQPVSVLVENSKNDAYFLRAVFRLYDSTDDTQSPASLSRHCNEGWLQFENAGGNSNVANFIDSRIQMFKGKSKFLRCFVLLDCDRRFPEETIAKNESIIRKLDNYDIPYHILEKRCMENYLPLEALPQDNKRQRQWLTAFKTLTPEQRDHFYIDTGFSKDVPAMLKEKAKAEKKKSKDKRKDKKSFLRKYLAKGIRTFYKDVSEGNFIHLEQGFPMPDIKTGFPLLFDKPVVTKERLDNITAHQTNPNELNDIVTKIRNIL